MYHPLLILQVISNRISTLMCFHLFINLFTYMFFLALMFLCCLLLFPDSKWVCFLDIGCWHGVLSVVAMRMILWLYRQKRKYVVQTRDIFLIESKGKIQSSYESKKRRQLYMTIYNLVLIALCFFQSNLMHLRTFIRFSVLNDTFDYLWSDNHYGQSSS